MTMKFNNVTLVYFRPLSSYFRDSFSYSISQMKPPKMANVEQQSVCSPSKLMHYSISMPNSSCPPKAQLSPRDIERSNTGYACLTFFAITKSMCEQFYIKILIFFKLMSLIIRIRKKKSNLCAFPRSLIFINIHESQAHKWVTMNESLNLFKGHSFICEEGILLSSPFGVI